MRKQFLWIRHVTNILLMLMPHSRWFSLRRIVLSLSGVNIDKSVKFCGGGWIYGRGNLHIKKGTWLSPKTIFYTNPDAEIGIGENCDIGPGVKFMTGSHAAGSSSRRAGKGEAKKIIVGNGTWIGGYSIILGGVNIGDGCVIAAGSVVTLNIPDNILAAGVPAIKKKALLQ
jgi:maltose O-acetyltransferase